MARFGPKLEKQRAERRAKIVALNKDAERRFLQRESAKEIMSRGGIWQIHNERAYFKNKLKANTYYHKKKSVRQLVREQKYRNRAGYLHNRALVRSNRREVFHMGFVATASVLLLVLSIFVGQFATYKIIDDGYIGNNIYEANRLWHYTVVDDKLVKEYSFDWSMNRLLDKLTNFKSSYEKLNAFSDSKAWADVMGSTDENTDEDKFKWYQLLYDSTWWQDLLGDLLKDTSIGKALSAITKFTGYIYQIAVRIVTSLVDGFRIVYIVLFGGFA